MRNCTAITLLFLCISNLHAQQPQTGWKQWRGPLATGTAPDSNPPAEWSETKNIRWKTPLPGLGHSTPIVLGNHIFVTTAIPIGPTLPPKFSGAPGAHDNLAITTRQKFTAILLNRDTGKICLLYTSDAADE